MRPQQKQMSKQIANESLKNIFGELPDPKSRVLRESTIWGLDYEYGEKLKVTDRVAVVRGIKYLHYHKGIPIEGDMLSAWVSDDKIVKVRTCWHEIVDEVQETRKKVWDVKDSLAKVAKQFRAKPGATKKQNVKLRKAGLCYYGYHDVGKNQKEFAPAWKFTFEKNNMLYNKYVDAHSNELIDSDIHIANAKKKRKEN
jgi:hypothetical protein